MPGDQPQQSPNGEGAAPDQTDEQGDTENPLAKTIENAVKARDSDTLTVEDLLTSAGSRSFGPLLIVFGLITLSPVGSLPGIPSVVGLVIGLCAGQLLLGRSTPWLPARLSKLGFDRAKISRFQEKSAKWLARIDGLVTKRLDWAAGDIAQRVAAALVILLSVIMIPLELVPFAAAIPSSAIVLFGIALTAQDGLFMIVATAATGAAVTAAAFLLG